MKQNMLITGLERAMDAPMRDLPNRIQQAFAEAGDLRPLLEPEHRAGNPDRYTRHVLHADPQGRFTVVSLVWGPGQYTPVHGHYTWCGYALVEGTLEEEQFEWDRATQGARLVRTITRNAGFTCASHAGLEDIHRLSNRSEDTAISIHVYGVPDTRVSTHVNRITPERVALAA